MLCCYSKNAWILLRKIKVVEFTDEEINSGKQPFKTDENGISYYVDPKFPILDMPEEK